MKTVSAVLIVKNESAMLGRCLESVKDADEIIVCDTGSTDNTIEIAKQYTDKVYTDFVWCDSFEKARNHAKSKATSDWVLSIDADEFCHDFSKVREAIELDAQALNVRMVQGGVEPEKFFYFPRLFRNVPEIFWCGAIHNHLNTAPSRDSEVKITYDWSPAHDLDPNRALRILEKEVAEKGNDGPREMYYLGREYWYKKEFKKAVETLGKYVQIAHYLAEKADAFLIMSQAYSAMSQDDDARDACAQAIIINPNFKEALIWMANISPDRNAAQWRKMAELADNTGVLFQRVE